MRVRLGTRRSRLALVQSEWAAEQIRARAAAAGRSVETELVEIVTHGDVSAAPLASLGGTGVFVSALRDALLAGEVDIAVHSLKDLPTAPAPGLVVAAIPAREDPRDVLVARDGLTLAELPPGARVGTGSPRRAAQLRALGLGLEVVDVRGNVDTRLRLVTDRTVDAVVLALAGLRRLGRQDEASEVLDPLLMLPAPGQGALAVECREGDTELRAVLALVDEVATRLAVTAERALLAALEAGCTAPVGALAEVVEGENGAELSLRAVVAAADGSAAVRRGATVPLPDSLHVYEDHDDVGEASEGVSGRHDAAAAAAALGRALAAEMLADGSAQFLPVAATPRNTARSSGRIREGDL